MIKPEAFEALSTSKGGIAKLKQLILDLAVRGLLVPQDPNDEPASELLEKCKIEKQKLIDEGVLKKSPALPDLDLSNIPFEIPNSWAWARFSELGLFGRGKSKHRPRNDPSLFTNGTHLMVQTGDVARAKGVITTHTSKYNDVGLEQSKKWPAGTLCITIAANIADSGILGFDACFPDSVVGFVPVSCFKDAKYFEYFMRTAKANLLEFAPSTAQKNINLEILNSVLIPLPPLNEQERIIAKVDELMEFCDKIEKSQTHSNKVHQALLDTLLANLLQSEDNQAFQATWSQIVSNFDMLLGSEADVEKIEKVVLDLAVQGKLGTHDVNDEPASVLIEKINIEKHKLIKDGTIKKQVVLSDIADDEKPFEIPDNWEWLRFPAVCHYKVGKTPSTKSSVYWSNDSDDYHWVSIGDMVHYGNLSNTSKKITQLARDDVFKYAPVPAGTILMSFKLTVGKISILDVAAYHNEAIISINPFDGVDKNYLFKILPERALAGNTKNAIKGNTLNSDSLSLLLIPLPPLEEQKRIVKKVDELMKVCDLIKEKIRHTNKIQERLATAIVEKAVA